jgi:hypothetical protein
MFRLIGCSLVFCLSACTSGLLPKAIEDTGGFVSPSSDVVGIVVVPAEVIVPEGTEIHLQALALNSERESFDVTDVVEWSIGSTTVAEVSNALAREGILTGQSTGVTSVHAEFDGVQSSPSRITVTDAELVRLGISPASVLIGVDDTIQLHAEATFADGSSSNASSQVRWITGNGSIVTLSEGGVLKAVDEGVTTVVIEWNGVESDPIEVTVTNDLDTSGVDLVIDGVHGDIAGGYLEIVADVRNAGTGVAEAFWVDLFVDPVITPSYGDLPNTYYMVDYLGPGESTSVTFSTSTPESAHEFGVLLDSMQEVFETEEYNNYAAGTTEEGAAGGGETPASSDLPDLEFFFVSGFSTDTTTEFWVDVRNNGDATSESFYIDVFFDSSIDTPPALYEDGTVFEYQSGVGVGEVVYATLEVAESCESCGSWIMLDGYDFVEESDEDDNLFWYEMGDTWALPTSSHSE